MLTLGTSRSSQNVIIIKNGVKMNNETKKCMFCGEEILAVALKCKHCGEFLNKTKISFNQVKNKNNVSEKTLWIGKPSHFNYLFAYIIGVICILFFGLGLLIILIAIIRRNSTTFTITNKRVKAKKGIISRSIHEVFIKEIKSVYIKQGILERLFGIGTIDIGSAGTADIEVSFNGIPDVIKIKEKIQNLKEELF